VSSENAWLSLCVPAIFSVAVSIAFEEFVRSDPESLDDPSCTISESG